MKFNECVFSTVAVDKTHDIESKWKWILQQDKEGKKMLLFKFLTRMEKEDLIDHGCLTATYIISKRKLYSHTYRI